MFLHRDVLGAGKKPPVKVNKRRFVLPIEEAKTVETRQRRIETPILVLMEQSGREDYADRG